jgi:hypothetical protein
MIGGLDGTASAGEECLDIGGELLVVLEQEAAIR